MPTANAFNTERQHAQRQRVLNEAMGFYAETYPTLAGQGVSTTGTQRVYGVAIGLLAGDVVSNLSVRLITSGNTVTLAKLGLYSKAGVLLASTADMSTQMNAAAGLKTAPVALVSGQPFTVPADDLYYAAFLAVSGVTMPSLGRVSAFGADALTAPVGSGSLAVVTQTGQTDLPAQATFTAGGGSAIVVWIGVS